MSDKEIIEAFIGCCISHRLECENCPYGNHLDCMSDICNDIIALIKRQQAEIERLKRENKILSINADNAFQDGLNEAQDLYAEQVKNEVQAEAINEFADRLKANRPRLNTGKQVFYITPKQVDDHVNEMLGAENE